MIRIWATIGLVLVAQAPAVGLAAATAPAAVAAPAAQAARAGQLLPSDGDTLTPNFRDAVYGDFLQVGNSVLRCPVDGEETGGNSVADCVAATQNETPSGLLDNRSNNNGYYMHAADDDGDDSTFDSSRAELTIPPGATVRYAQLHWGGHTGKFVGFSGVNCIRPLLLQGQPPPAPAASAPDQQDVTLSVDGGDPEGVARVEENFTFTEGLAEPSEIYTGWADVTSRFDGVRTGEPIQVSVGNVWAPTGPGCAGGWSLVVVFGYDEPQPDFSTVRVVDLYTGNLPNGGMLMPGIIEPLIPGFPSQIDDLLPGLLPGLTGSSVVLPGVNPSRGSAGVTIGVTAYDGDWNQGAETLEIDGEAATDPCLNDAAEDFFRSCANNAIDPIDDSRRPQNNMSVDSKTFMPQLEDNDTGEIELRVDSVADFFVLQNVVLAESVTPEITITNDGPTGPVQQGDLATFDITVENTGSVPLYDIVLEDTSDQQPPGAILCTPRTVQPLDPGESATVSCMETAGAEPFTNTAKVTATYLTPANGGEPRTVTASDPAEVDVTVPDFAVQRVPDKLITHVGEPVTFTVTLFNNTDSALTNVSYTDDATDDCGTVPTTLAADSSATFECVVASPQETFDSAGSMSGTTSQGGIGVTSQTVRVVVIDPVLTVSATVDKDTIYTGDTVTLTFTVTNTATDPDETLNNIVVTVEELPDCQPEPIESLAAGESVDVTCTARPQETVDAVAQAEGTDLTDEPVTASSEPVRITVLEAPLRIEQSADRTTVRVENTEVTFTFTVTNTDDPEDPDARTLHDVQIGNVTIPNCEPEVIETLGPGQSDSRTCTAGPDRTFDSVASATALDEEDRPMRVLSDPLRITVINPVMVITSSVDPNKAKHGASVRFTVTVRNIGDVPLSFQVTNDQAKDCDFETVDENAGLSPNAAQGRVCIEHTPTSDGEPEFVNVANFEALPIEAVGDDGEALTGETTATVELQDGQAPPEPTPAPGDGGDSGGSGGSGGSASGGDGGGLAITGASIAVPLVLAISLLVGGALMALAARRPEEGDEGFLARWWPGN